MGKTAEAVLRAQTELQWATAGHHDASFALHFPIVHDLSSFACAASMPQLCSSWREAMETEANFVLESSAPSLRGCQGCTIPSWVRIAPKPVRSPGCRLSGD